MNKPSPLVKKSFNNTIINYIGGILGFVITFFLLPKLFTPKFNGIFRLFIDLSVTITIISSLGLTYSVFKFYPKISNGQNHNNGLLFWIITIPLVGFFLVATLLIAFKDQFINTFAANSPDFIQYLPILIIFSFICLYLIVFESYNSVIGQVTFSAINREIIQRFFIISSLAIFFFFDLEFIQFLYFVTIGYAISLVISIIFNNKFTANRFYVSKYILKNRELRKDFITFSSLLFISNIFFILVQKLDILFISALVDLKSVAVFGIAATLVTVIEIPTRSILQASNPVLTKAIHDNDLDLIKKLYLKTSINQYLIGCIIFLFLWINIDTIYNLIPNHKVYESGKLIFLILGFSKLLVLIQGNSSSILTYSKKFYLIIILNIISLFLGIIFNYFLINRLGTIGGSISTALIFLISTIAICAIIWNIFKMSPLVRSNFNTTVLMILALIINQIFIYFHPNNLFIIIIKNILILSMFLFIVYKLRISGEMNIYFKHLLKKIKVLK